MTLRRAGGKDLGNLVKMNIELREDEKATDTMSESRLLARMNRWLGSKSYDVFLLAQEGKTLGYALVDHAKKPIYVRHLYVKRDCRRRGYGTEALDLLRRKYGTDELELDVNSWNEGAIKFYESYGFRKTFIAMKFKRPG